MKTLSPETSLNCGNTRKWCRTRKKIIVRGAANPAIDIFRFCIYVAHRNFGSTGLGMTVMLFHDCFHSQAEVVARAWFVRILPCLRSTLESRSSLDHYSLGQQASLFAVVDTAGFSCTVLLTICSFGMGFEHIPLRDLNRLKSHFACKQLRNGSARCAIGLREYVVILAIKFTCRRIHQIRRPRHLLPPLLLPPHPSALQHPTL